MAHPEVQTVQVVPTRWAGTVVGDTAKREGVVLWRCWHKHRTKAFAQRCAEKWLPWVERDQSCTCTHPGRTGRHTIACDAAHKLMRSPAHFARPIGAEFCDDINCDACRIGKLAVHPHEGGEA